MEKSLGNLKSSDGELKSIAEHLSEIQKVEPHTNDQLVKNSDVLKIQLQEYESDFIRKQDELLSKEQEITNCMGKEVLLNQQIDQKEYLEQRLSHQIKDEANISAKLQSIDDSIQKLVGELGGDVGRTESVDDQLTQKNSLLEQQKKQIEDINNHYHEYASLLSKYEERKKQLESFLKSEQNKLAQNRTELKSILIKSGIGSNEEYLAFKKQLPQIQLLEAEITTYKQKLEINKNLLKELEQDVQGKSYYDIEHLTKKYDELTQISEELSRQQLSFRTRFERNGSCIKNLIKNQRASQKINENYQLTANLFRIASGNNHQRLSFERYVLASYFEDVIESANKRLVKMTNTRYELKRKEDKGKHGKGAGLDLEVFDSYTGKLRHVNTLSGGESFKASLCLALGLADVISNYAGGVEVDTMFIDEGFGTLDANSLDTAISCLMQLQTHGRLIGIISHVPELKERIAAKLLVTSTKSGSTIRFSVD
jgi:exonuclease SbcC